MITVRLPSILRKPGEPSEIVVTESVETIADLVRAMSVERPDLAEALDDPIYNFAVNDALLVHGARQHVLTDGDVVEIVPTISGGGSPA